MPRRQYDYDDEEGFGEASRYTAHLDRGWSLLDRGDLQRARNSAHQAQRLRPEVPDAAMLMAAISLADGDAESGLEWYERAIEADTEYVDAQLAAAQLLLYDLDEPQRALHRAEQARELDEATLADRIDLGLLELEALLALDDQAGANARLEQFAELRALEALISPDSEPEELRMIMRELAGDPPDFDSDDAEQLMHRVFALLLRVARLHTDLGAPAAALQWLQGVLRSLSEDADVWYLTNEAAYLAGDGVRAAHAALQVLQLDTRIELPDWAPSPSDIHQKVVEILRRCPDASLNQLAREPSFVVVVNEAPPFELVLEGVDPRVRALALAARSSRELEGPPTLTGMALYRRNLLRLVRDATQLDHELEFAVLDELAAFFGFDDARRERLGIGQLPWTPSPLDPGRRANPDSTAEASPRATKASSSKTKPAKKKPAKKKTKKTSAKKKAVKKKTKKSAANKNTAKKKAAKKTAKASSSKTKPAKKKAAKKKSAKKKSKKKSAKKKAAKKAAKKKPAEAKPRAERRPSKPKARTSKAKPKVADTPTPKAKKKKSTRTKPAQDDSIDE